MARLEAAAKMLYYPTSAATMALIGEAFWPLMRPENWAAAQSQGAYDYDRSRRLIPIAYDPSCGDGSALEALVTHPRLEGVSYIPMGVELDVERAAAAQARFSQLPIKDLAHKTDTSHKNAPKHLKGLVAQGSRYGARLNIAPAVIFDNPPYDNDSAKGSRQEVTSLLDMLRGLQPLYSSYEDVLLLWVVPEHILFREDTARALWAASWLHTVRLPEDEYPVFKQCLLAAKVRPGLAKSSRGESAAKIPDPAKTGHMSAAWAQRLNVELTRPYSGPSAVTVTKKSLMYLPNVRAGRMADPMLAAPSPQGGVWASGRWDTLTHVTADGAMGAPLAPLAPGHLALLLASGALGGQQVGNSVVKSRTTKVLTTEVVEATDDDGEDTGKVKRVSTERLDAGISVLSLDTGDYEVLSTGSDPARLTDWLKTHGDEVGRAITASFPAVCSAEWADTMGYFIERTYRAPRAGHSVRPAQARTVAYVLDELTKRSNRAVIQGEPGCGKTLQGSIVAASMARGGVSVVVAPGHLIDKWAEEATAVTGLPATICETFQDVDAVFAAPAVLGGSEDAPEGMRPYGRILILSEMTAKLGQRWEHSCENLGTAQRPRWVCPECGTALTVWPPIKPVKARCGDPAVCADANEAVEESDDLLDATNAEHASNSDDNDNDGAEKTARKRRKMGCGAALWTTRPLNNNGTLRHPLGLYLAHRYAREYGLVIDEVHEAAASDSTRSRCFAAMIAGARWTLGLTGTFSGGKASSMFHLLYKLDPNFREVYGYQDETTFVADHGFIEETTEVSETTSALGVKRNDTKRVREIPGLSPGIVQHVLPMSVWIRLSDLGIQLPPMTEHVELVKPEKHVQDGSRDLAEALKAARTLGARFLSTVAQAAIGWPDAPGHDVMLTVPPVSRHFDFDRHTKAIEAMQAGGYVGAPQADGSVRFRLLTGTGDLITPTAKDLRAVEMAKDCVANGGRMLIYVTQTTIRDPRRRLVDALKAAGLCATFLPDAVSPRKRMAWFDAQVRAGVNVVVLNGARVATGVDLLQFDQVLCYGTEYRARLLRQMSRRTWRIGQDRPVRIHYLAYEDTGQHVALNMTAAKLTAMDALDGQNPDGGLADIAAMQDAGNAGLLDIANEIIRRAA